MTHSQPDDFAKTLVVIDAVSSGQYLPPRIREAGYHCVHVISSPAIPETIHTSLEELVRSNAEVCSQVLVYHGDLESLIQKLGPYRITGVIAGSEPGVLLADQLSERLGLPSNGTALSAARRDKSLMQQILKEAGVRTKMFFSSDSPEKIVMHANKENLYPVVIKPLDAAGTEGVTFCDNAEEVLRACHAIQGSKNIFGQVNRAMLLEERLFGTEYGVNTVSWDGRHKLVELWRYRKERLDGRSVLYDCTKLQEWPNEPMMEIVRYAFSVLDGLGIRYGPAHTEIMLTTTGPVLVESGARPMGGQIPPELIEECIGQSQIGQVVLAYSDPARFLEQVDQPFHLKKHLIRKHLISRLEGSPQEEINAVDSIAKLPSVNAGDFVHLIEAWHVDKTVDMFTSPAKVFLIHEEESVVIADYKKIRDMERDNESEFYGNPVA